MSSNKYTFFTLMCYICKKNQATSWKTEFSLIFNIVYYSRTEIKTLTFDNYLFQCNKIEQI